MMPRSWHLRFTLPKLLLDLLVWSAGSALAYLARFDGAIPSRFAASFFTYFGLVLVAKLVAILLSRIHLQTWRTVTLRDIAVVAQAVAAVTVAIMVVSFMISPHLLVIPRSVPLLDGIISLLLLLGVRAARRLTYENGLAVRRGSTPQRRVLIIGAGDAGALTGQELLRHPDTGLEPVAYLDDDPAKQGHRLAGLPILGPIDDVQKAIDAFQIDEVLIAVPSKGGRILRRVIDLTRGGDSQVEFRIVPAIREVIAGNVTVQRIRPVEVDDLLRRPPVELDVKAIEAIVSGQAVMVTGAGGSIGSEIVRQLARFAPRLVVLLGRGENSLYVVERELDRDFPQLSYCSVIADVRDRNRLEQVFGKFEPHTVFHAAAHKHVPLMEANPEEAILNNVLGTRNVAELSVAHGVRCMVNISSDKAVNPTSIMGATKRIGEYAVQAASANAAPGQVLLSVRFGNVLGSRGSVIPLFKEQIRAGGPVTVTHRDMQRYFMTIPEATQLVLQAASVGHNGEIYILDMGEPVRILDLARDLIRLSGLEPDEDIAIEFSGIRPGEKLFEELLADREVGARALVDGVFVARTPSIDPERLRATIDELEAWALAGRAEAIRATLATFIEGARLEVGAG
jgi:FlaA1/EpsC-like NDP-sugar epimerase